jgi:hypothetical protein
MNPGRMKSEIFQKELVFDLQDYRCPECASFDFEASQFIPVQYEAHLLGLVSIECQDCGWTWDSGYLFTDQQYGELVEQRYTEWQSVR